MCIPEPVPHNNQMEPTRPSSRIIMSPARGSFGALADDK
jgi:hypothetical protein